MKMIEIVVHNPARIYYAHAANDSKIGALIEMLEMQIEKETLILYHRKTGRFLNERMSFDELGIESGDRIEVIWR